MSSAQSSANSDKGSGTGQYFTPRALIQAIVDVVRPTVADTVVDPACGTGGFLLVAHEHAARGAESMTPVQRDHLRDGFASGYELVDSTARLAAMNLLLHGMGTSNGDSLIEVRDSLIADPGRRWSVVLSNPPFGRKSSVTMVGTDGREVREDREIERQDFVATTSNKQLNFVQHIATILDTNGRAAVVLPDNVLFEGGAGETIRRKLLTDFNLHTMLRLPTGIFYAQGVKANVLLFDKKVARPGQPWTERLWVYDLRTNKHFALKQNPLRRADLDEFVAVYTATERTGLSIRILRRRIAAGELPAYRSERPGAAGRSGRRRPTDGPGSDRVAGANRHRIGLGRVLLPRMTRSGAGCAAGHNLPV